MMMRIEKYFSWGDIFFIFLSSLFLGGDDHTQRMQCKFIVGNK